MFLRIKTQNVKLTSRYINQIEKRFQTAFQKTRDRVQGLTITLSDINGPKGGVDKQCKILVDIERQEPVVVVERQSSLGGAISGAMHRSKHSVLKKLKSERLRQSSARRGIILH